MFARFGSVHRNTYLNAPQQLTRTLEVRSRPDAGAPLAFVAAQNVALELLGSAPGGWLRVRHADGANGYLRATQVWGG